MEQNRVYYPGFDVVKMILAILIVAAHCHFLEETGALLYGVAGGIEAFAIPSFFAISAFLFYGKVVSTFIIRIQSKLDKLKYLY